MCCFFLPGSPELLKRNQRERVKTRRENSLRRTGPKKKGIFRGFETTPRGSEVARAARHCRIGGGALTFPRCLCSRGRYTLPSGFSVLAGVGDPGWSLLPPRPRSRLPARLRRRREAPAEHRGRLEGNAGGEWGFFTGRAPPAARGAFPPRQPQSREALGTREGINSNLLLHLSAESCFPALTIPHPALPEAPGLSLPSAPPRFPHIAPHFGPCPAICTRRRGKDVSLGEKPAPPHPPASLQPPANYFGYFCSLRVENSKKKK